MRKCKKCKKAELCMTICPEVENELKLGHSLNSNYFIKTVDPFIIQKLSYVEGNNYFYRCDIDRLKFLLKTSLSKMSKRRKHILCKYYGLIDCTSLTQVQIAKVLHISQNTVKYHLQKGRKFIKDYISERFRQFKII